MPRYGEGSPYQFGTSFSNHSSLMTTTGSGRLHGPLVSRYSPHLSTISESPLGSLRRYSPVVASPSRPKRVDTADIDVSTPRNLSHTDNHGRNGIRRDRPTIRIRSQALKDNPALRELNQKHEKTVGELLVEKFMIKDKAGQDAIAMVKAYRQPSLERAGNEATQKKITRRLTRRRSSLEIPTDSEIIAREVIIAQAQAEALDSLLEQEQAQYKVESRRRTLTKRSRSRDSISLPSESSDNEFCAMEEAERPSSIKKTIKKTKKKKKILNKSLSQPEDADEQITESPHLTHTKSDSSLILQSHSPLDSGEERRRIRPQKFKIEACNSVGDFSTLWINASSEPTSPVATEQFRESIRLPAPKSNKDTSFASVIDDDRSESEDDMVVLALPKRYVRDSTRNSVHLTLKTAVEQPTITRTRKVGNAGISVEKNSSIGELINSRHSENRFNDANSVNDRVNGTDNSKDFKELEITTTSLMEKEENLNNVDQETENRLNTKIKISDNVPKLSKNIINKSNFRFKDTSEKKAVQNASDVQNSISTVSVLPKENVTSIPDRIGQESLNDIVKIDKSSESKIIAEVLEDNVSKFSKKPIKKSDSQSKDISVKKPAQNLSNVPHSESESSVLSTKINDVSASETVPETSSNDIDDIWKSVEDVEKVSASSKSQAIEESLSDNIAKPSKKPIKKMNSQDIGEKKASQASEISVLPTKSNDLSAPETMTHQPSDDNVESPKPIQGIIKVGTSSESKVNTEKSSDNVSRLPKKPIKKISSQPKGVSTKQPSNNLSDVPNSKSEVSGLFTKTKDTFVSDTIDQQSANEIVKVGTKLGEKLITENLLPENLPESNALSPPISEVDFWGEIDPESTPSSPTSKLSLKIDNSLAIDVPVASKEETVNIGDATLVSTKVEDTSIQAETDLDKNSRFKDTPRIHIRESSDSGKKENEVSVADDTTAVNSSLSNPLDDKTSEIDFPPKDNAFAKDQDVDSGTKPVDKSAVQAITSHVDEDDLLTPTPELEEKKRNSVSDIPLPTINIVAAPLSPGPNGIGSTIDEDPSTPTNEWPNASLTMSKWVSQNDLSETTEVDQEATPTPPSGPDIGVSPQSSKKKKVVKKKKPAIKKSESEDNGSVDNSQKAAKQLSEKTPKPSPKPTPKPSPKPSPQNSPKCSPRSSPRNSPKQRPIDLIRMFYTTPGPLLTATPRDLSKVRRGGRRKKRNLSTTSSASDSTESARSTQSTTSTEDTSSTCTEGAEETKDEKRLTSTRSNDSGFDGSPRLTNCDMACHKKCEKLTGNLCGLNQKLVAEALQALKRAPSQSSDSQRSEKPNRFQASGRITPPATNLPRFKKYAVTDFNFLKVLGKGSFGKVLLAELRDTDCLYAVKCLKKDVVLEDDDVECTLIERKVLTLATRHPYLCHLFCTFQTDSHLFFVMEYLNGGDLMFHIQRAGRFTESRARFYAAEILSGLNFLHKKGIVYRDLKLDNVLLDFDGHIRIADFGMCKLQIYLDRTADTFCGTPDYMAPEIIKGMKYNQAVDWWSYGVLLYEMLTGQSPFSGCDEDELFWSICNERPFIPRYLSQESTDILVCLLEKDAGKRLPGHEIAIHPFFQGLPWDRLERRQLEPPFKPALEHTLDTRYFDSTFTAERPRLSIVPEQILISMDQGVFRGFSYTNPNATD